MIGMREILSHFSNVSSNAVVGMRAPYLKPGRNTQYSVCVYSLVVIPFQAIAYRRLINFPSIPRFNR